MSLIILSKIKIQLGNVLQNAVNILNAILPCSLCDL